MKPKPLGTPTVSTAHRLSGRVISSSLVLASSRLGPRAREIASHRHLSKKPPMKPPNHPQIPTLSHVTHASGGSHWVSDAVWWSVVRVVVMVCLPISFRQTDAGKADNEQNRDWEIPQGKLIRCPPALVRMMTFMPNCRD